MRKEGDTLCTTKKTSRLGNAASKVQSSDAAKEQGSHAVGQELGQTARRIALECIGKPGSEVESIIQSALAAEREKREAAEKESEELKSANRGLYIESNERYQQLLQAQAAIVTAKKRTWAMAEKWPELESIDLSSLDKHDADLRAQWEKEHGTTK